MPLIETKGAASAQGFGEFSGPSGPVIYIEDVFSTYLYTGNGSTQTITNGIDLSTKGGMVWIKNRSLGGTNHALQDTVRGRNNILFSNDTVQNQAYSTSINSFNSTGFTLGSENLTNQSGQTFVSWTFREQPKFYDVVTYTGDGQTYKQVFHNLKAPIGMMIIKRIDSTSNWSVVARTGASSATGPIALNSTGIPIFSNANVLFGDSLSGGANTFFYASQQSGMTGDDSTNVSGGTYVAYLFAHNAGGFGLSGTDNVISCGSYTGSNGAGQAINLGYEAQWVLIKNTSRAGQNWVLMDNMRSFDQTNYGWLYPNTSGAEATGSGAYVVPTATGFATTTNANAATDYLTDSYIYIAIRRGPMKVPTSGTSVYTPITRSGNSTATTVTGVGFAPDLVFEAARTNSGGNNWVWFDRLRGGAVGLSSDNTGAEFTNSAVIQSDSLSTTMDGFRIQTANPINSTGNTYVYYPLRRAPGFFDEVCYTGTGSATTQAHNLGVVPELMIVKQRSGTNAWQVYSSALANTEYLVLNTTAAKATGATRWNSTTPTSTVFSIGTASEVNTSTATYVAHLFATCAGVSKVGSYTGTGALQTVNCGFTGGARFVLIKRTDSTGDWYVYDSARGISSGNDPYLFMNSTAAEVTGTNYVDTASVGFQVTAAAPAGLNANGGTYIFLAIA
jgi:hypothetical protein